MALKRTNTGFNTRYTPAGDEFLFVEFDEAMSLEANLEIQEIAVRVLGEDTEGIIDICPANVSYLVRYDPDVVTFDALVQRLKKVERSVKAEGLEPFKTRVIDVPVLFNDPWTYEVLMKFRDRVQDPSKTDIEYLADVNGFGTVEDLIEAVTSAPSMATMTGFVPGILWSFQLVAFERQIQAPKYLRPRTETPERAFAVGGAYPVVYPSPSAGGYPMLGRAAAPIYDPAQRLKDFADDPAFVRTGDVLNFRSIDRAEYDRIQDEVAAGTFSYLQRPITFEPGVFFESPEPYCHHLREVLYRD
ncbi:carboxyltransferase domain-containing protein [Arthrobacter sp. OAP107]|uniref:5-oxoprolinase subunit B family protein n=1 Tax=Arthrobacter sp. OAP107 TaxID=3156445 RepID=UPI0033925DAB